jgi:hypothetical protein
MWLGDVGDVRTSVFGDEPAGELAQGAIGGVDAARREERGELQQVAAHRADQLRGLQPTARPIRDPNRSTGSTARRCRRQRRRSSVDLLHRAQLGCGVGVDRSVARRYSPASQSLVRCR